MRLPRAALSLTFVAVLAIAGCSKPAEEAATEAHAAEAADDHAAPAPAAPAAAAPHTSGH